MKNFLKIFNFILTGIFVLQTNLVLTQVPTTTNTPTNKSNSYNWTKYATSTNNFTQVSNSWIIPTVTSADTFGADATWIGIGGVNTGDLIQTGTQTVNNSGNISYQTWYEMLPGV